jgi:rare lipoprotein A
MAKILFALSFAFFSNAFSKNAFAHTYGPYKIGTPYKIEGTEYTPAEVRSYNETGVASWYGKEFQGKPTANGGIFDSNSYTAAHRTLPMPSVVLITNITNNKKTIAVINDRGPFSKETGRIIDVSQKVAEKLGFANVGRANVKVEYIPDLSQKLRNNEDFDLEEYSKMYEEVKSEEVKKARVTKVENAIDINQKIANAGSIGQTAFTKDYIKAIYVQIGVFQVLANAQKVYQSLGSIQKIQLKSEGHNAKNYYIVRSGPFANIIEAEKSKTEISQQCKECETMIVII